MVPLVFALVLLCYWPALRGALLWDDPAHVTRPELRSWAGLGRIWWDVGATQQYYPVLHSVFWIEHRLWGDSTLGYHLANVLWHAASCCLLALLLRRLWSSETVAVPGGPSATRSVPAGTAWFAALLFAVHPMSVESVAWISEQKNTLSLLCYFLAAWVYLDFSAHRRWRSYGWATLWFFLAVGTKSVTATLPAALLVVLWWKHGRLSWRRDVLPLLPWFLLAAVAGLFTAWVERKLIGAEGMEFDLSAVQRVLLAGRVLWFYLGKLVWPAGQAFFYERWDVAAAATGWAGCLVATGVVTAGLWAVRRRCRGLLAGWLLFGGSLFPALGFFNVYPFVFSYVADHFQYLASVALLATVTAAVAVVLEGAPRWAQLTVRGLGCLLVLGFAGLAARQSRLYVNNETLFRATLAQSPDSWMAHHILGFTLAMSPGNETEAIRQYREALRLNPDYPDAHTGLALELAKQPGHEAEAIAHYGQALRLKPQAADTHNNLGLILSSQPGRLPEALGHYEAALRLKPDFPEARVNLANALMTLPGREAEALAHYEAALRLNPDSPEMRDNYALALAKQPGRAPEAWAQWEEALRLKPDFAGAHANLANSLVRAPGRLPEALAHYEQALRLDPGLAGVHYNLANALVQLPGRAGEALVHYETALRLDPARPWVHLALALQLSSISGREAEATQHAETALQLKPDFPEAHNCLAIICAQQGRLEEARAHWTTALQLNPNYETARANLQRLERMTGHR